MNDYVTELEERRRELGATIAEKSRKLQDLMNEVNTAKRKIGMIEELLRLETGAEIEPIDADQLPIPMASARLRTVVFRAAPTAGSPVADAAYDVLKERGEPMHYSTITAALTERGVPIGGRDPNNNVIAALTRDKRFYRPRRGTYALTELAKGPVRSVGIRHKKGA